VIAVVGLLLTTGGNDERGRSPDNLAVERSNYTASIPHLQETLDVRLHTQAHLQAQGGTPAPTSQVTDSDGEEGLGALDGVLDTVQTVLEPQYGGARREESVISTICAYPWPQGCDYWIGVAWCESTLGQDPWAYDDRNPYIGLFQVDEAHGYGREWLKDDANNTLAAWELSREGTRTSPWPYCQWQ